MSTGREQFRARFFFVADVCPFIDGIAELV